MGWLDNLVNHPSSGQILAEEAIGVPLTLAGLLGTAVGIPLAAPELALGGALSGLGYQGLQNNRDQERNEKTGSYLASRTPDEVKNEAGKIIGRLTGFGYTPDEAINMYNGLVKAHATAMPKQEVQNGQLITFPTAAGAQATASPIVGYIPPTKQPGSPESLWEQQWLSTHPGDFAGAATFAEQQKAKYQKSPVINIGFGGYGTDASGKPVALERNPHTGAMRAVSLPPGVTPGSPKPAKNPGDVISAAKSKALSEWKAESAYKTSSTGTIQKLFNGMKISDPVTYANLRAAVALKARNLLPNDIQVIDPKAKFTGKVDKQGRPVYQTKSGLMASDDF